MLRWRFGTGLIVGLLVGMVGGTLIGISIVPPSRPATAMPEDSADVAELRRRLEHAREEKERAQAQFERFQQLADQMTAGFNALEQRFRALESQERARVADAVTAAPHATSSVVSPAPADGTPRPPGAGADEVDPEAPGAADGSGQAQAQP